MVYILVFSSVDYAVVDSCALRHRRFYRHETTAADPVEWDSGLNLPSDLLVSRLGDVGSTGPVQPKATRITLQSILGTGNTTIALRARILLHWHLHLRRLRNATIRVCWRRYYIAIARGRWLEQFVGYAYMRSLFGVD